MSSKREDYNLYIFQSLFVFNELSERNKLIFTHNGITNKSI